MNAAKGIAKYETNMENLKKLHKLALAEMHLDRAIRVFLENQEYPCAISLAGIADEVLGKYVTKAGGRPAMKTLLNSLVTEQILDGLTPKEILGQFINGTKNDLKHGGDNAEDHLNRPWQTDAIGMILRASTNYKALNGGKLSPHIIAFVKHIRSERPDLFEKRTKEELDKLDSMMK